VIVVSKKICARIKGELIPCGVDLELFKPVDRVTARNRLGLSLDKTFILFPFDPRRKVKRVELAQSAVDLMSDPQVQLLSVSGKTNEEMPLYYSAADAMVLCSESEGSPTSVKEALACNLPVVSVDVGDVREIIDGVAGCEICLCTPESLANGLRRVLSRKWDRPFDGRQSMARYDQDSTVKAVIEVYDRVIREQHSRYDS
jgi:glycosyltransferase involved in cell wall biosynthesis